MDWKEDKKIWLSAVRQGVLTAAGLALFVKQCGGQDVYTVENS